MKIYIKYMVCLRCKLVVQEQLRKLELSWSSIDLGMVDVIGEISDSKYESLKNGLLRFGLELLDDKKSILIERIQNVIIQMVHYADELPAVNISQHISEKLNYDYIYLANIFSEVKGITIKQFIIIQKIERVKELLFYNELNLTEISYKLNYSSVAHLSNQFKKITGLAPTFYKKLKEKRQNHEHL